MTTREIFNIITIEREERRMDKIFENLLKEYSGMLSRMKIRDGNEELNKICLEEFKKDLEKGLTVNKTDDII